MEEEGAGERPPLLFSSFEGWTSSQEADDDLAHREDLARSSGSEASRPRRYWPGGPRIKDPTVVLPPAWVGSQARVPQARVQEVEQQPAGTPTESALEALIT